MSLTSGDRAFAEICRIRDLIAPEVLAAKADEVAAKIARGEAVTLADYLVDQFLLTAKQKDEVEKLRARHGRLCSACGTTTFLLPGEDSQKKPCERCGGRLTPRGTTGRAVPSTKKQPPPPKA